MKLGDLVRFTRQQQGVGDIGVVIHIYEKGWNGQQDIGVLWGDGIYTNDARDLEACNA